MRRIRLTLILILFMLSCSGAPQNVSPKSASATVIAQGSFENGLTPFQAFYGGASVISDATAPDGSHSLRIFFPEGCCDGTSPGVVSVNPEFWSDVEEVYVQFWIKYDSFWVDQHTPSDPMAGVNKWIYMWFGDTLNKPNLPIMGHHTYNSMQGITAVLQSPGARHPDDRVRSSRRFLRYADEGAVAGDSGYGIYICVRNNQCGAVVRCGGNGNRIPPPCRPDDLSARGCYGNHEDRKFYRSDLIFGADYGRVERLWRLYVHVRSGG